MSSWDPMTMTPRGRGDSSASSFIWWSVSSGESQTKLAPSAAQVRMASTLVAYMRGPMEHPGSNCSSVQAMFVSSKRMTVAKGAISE